MEGKEFWGNSKQGFNDGNVFRDLIMAFYDPGIFS